jgi:cobalt-precorrin 5A hydrolase/precorrin-3B C17-methyltransferase
LTLFRHDAMLPRMSTGTIYLVGIGPGDGMHLTPEAFETLLHSSVIIGNGDTLSQVHRLVHQTITMLEIGRNPLERSRTAAEKAAAGMDVAIVSPGHPGIYAIASTLLGFLKDNNLDIPVRVIPGLTLAVYASARLGSPLGTDYAVVSLADRAGKWVDIKDRLNSVIGAGLVVVIYNPVGAKKDSSRLRQAVNMASSCRPRTTPVGVVTDAADRNEKV